MHPHGERWVEKTEMQDSGKRQKFIGGAVRDAAEGKPRPELISPFFEERLANWLAKGAAKYDDRNWENGIPIDRCVASLKRHLMKWRQGSREEDHLAAIACNIMFIIHFEEMIKRGEMIYELHDVPKYSAEARAELESFLNKKQEA